MPDVTSSGHRRRIGLWATGTALVAVLLVVEFLTISAWRQIRTTNDTFGDSVYEVTNLANAQRDLLRLDTRVQRWGHGRSTLDEIQLQRDLLARQLQILENRAVDEDFRADLARVQVHLSAVDHLLRQPPRARSARAEVAETVAAELDIVGAIIQRRYDAGEMTYFEGVNAAIGKRKSTLGLLAGVAIGLAVIAAIYVVISRRASRAERRSVDARIAESEERYRTVVDSVRDVIFTTDDDGRWTFLSAVWEDLTGHPAASSLGRPFLDFVAPEARAGCAERFADLWASSDESISHEVPYLRANGTTVWVEVFVRKSGRGTSGRIVDITERRAVATKLQQLALHDPLTGLANRNLLAEHLSACLARRDRSGHHLAVLFLDLDRFKFVNDSLGHDVGDDLLVSVASRLRDLLRPSDVAARLGGDEFVVVLDDLDPVSTLALAQARQISARIEQAIGKPHVLADRTVVVTTSVGITLAEETDRPDEILAQADAAMYHAKGLGKGRHEVYDSAMQLEAADRLATEHDLRSALERDELELHYQPIIEARTGAVVSVEALLRWHHPTRGLLPPARFLEVAEEAGLTPKFAGWVLQTACRMGAHWLTTTAVPWDFSVAVNLSARQLNSPAIVSQVVDALNKHGLQPANLTIEITEDQMVGAHPHAIEALRRIHELGVQVAMDDFGTGYSSLSYLRQLPIDVLKIDRTFVSRIGVADDDTTIAEAVIRLGNSLGLVTVAEGVELPSQLRRLREFGCDRLQGYLLGRPVPADAVADALPLPELPPAPNHHEPTVAATPLSD